MPTRAEVIQALQFPGLYDLAPINTTADGRYRLTYQFETSQPPDLWYDYSGWTAFSEAEKASFRSALSTVEEFLNVEFVEVTRDRDPDFNFGKVDLPPQYLALGGPQYSTLNGRITRYDGFAVFDRSIDLASGEQGLILHEVGHALGLDHPFDGVALDPDFDTNHYTIMSYTDDPTPGIGETSRMMVYDFVALQDIWGATAFNAGDTAYLGPRVNGVDVIWDSAGTDSLDARGWARGVELDLRQGEFSEWMGREDMAIAFDVRIENAYGSLYGDTLIGNALANALYGGPSGDLLRGTTGDDILDGQAGNDTLRGGRGADVVEGGAGNDTVKGTRGRDTVRGGEGDDLVKGGGGRDSLFGDGGDDDLRGWRGADRLDGGTGADTLRGGPGADTFVFRPGYGADRITDFGNGNDRIEVTGFGDAEAVMDLARATGGDVVIDFGESDALTIEDTTLSAVEQALVV
jgi:serralysin